ncbi:MAG: STAS domain-containing protein [Desulfomonile tiedjei]|uniref:Anti-sigma factor antagonist n=1 Tax=Desulfomonile tiedjei TaxID=2358 RepID=A0A9D6V6L7_9BACT|nr:STAS domain-containing protein [Desulfomonile tiedjei]
MELKIVGGDYNFTRIALSGKLDVAGEGEIGDHFRDLVSASSTSFIVDMSQVTYLASLGIRLLFSAAKTLVGNQKKMVVLNPQPMVEETLLNSGTAKLIPVTHDEAEALRLLTA